MTGAVQYPGCRAVRTPPIPAGAAIDWLSFLAAPRDKIFRGAKPQTCRSSGFPVRADHQSEDRQASRPDHPTLAAAAGRSGHRRAPDRWSKAILPQMAYKAWFQCINGCPGGFDLREV